MLFGMVLAAAVVAQGQSLSGAAFEDLASRTDALCPARAIRSITPGDLDFAQTEFEARLTNHERARLSAANRADDLCAGQNGLSCPTTKTLAAMRTARLIPRFAAYICTHPVPGSLRDRHVAGAPRPLGTPRPIG